MGRVPISVDCARSAPPLPTPFLMYVCARTLSELSFQIGAIAIAWQIYALTNSALALGLIGLVQFFPTCLFTFVAGHAADRFDRKTLVQSCQLVEAMVAAFLTWSCMGGLPTPPLLFAAVVTLSAASAFKNPAMAALLPAVIPNGALQKGAALSTAAFQVAIIAGPALGGLALAVAPGLAYASMTLCWLAALGLNAAIRIDRAIPSPEHPSLKDIFAGVLFVRREPAILGAISLDLFAVLLGGATALLPIYARDILHTGAWGLGLLRAAPAVGALLMSSALAHRAITRRAGLRMFEAVIVFGLATIVFAMSRQIWLSVLALALLGAADSFSMIIRSTLVQLATPGGMRGRVGAVNFLFVHTSSQLGEFQSGVAAALLGAAPAALIGGISTILFAFLWMRLFPSLRDMESLQEVKTRDIDRECGAQRRRLSDKDAIASPSLLAPAHKICSPARLHRPKVAPRLFLEASARRRSRRQRPPKSDEHEGHGYQQAP